MLVVCHVVRSKLCLSMHRLNETDHKDRRSIAATFVASSPRRRVTTTLVLLCFVAFVVPYQFAYLVACIVQLATTVRALRFAHDNVS